jgi:thiosulfate dehydrogenase [quinone] large subunit
MFLIYLSLFPPVNHPFIDEHIIYILVFLGLAVRGKTQSFGLGQWWAKFKFVKQNPWLK